MEYDYDAQLKLKRKQVADKLARLGELKDPKVRMTEGMTDPWRYRNKAVFQVDIDGSVGFFRKRSRFVVDCSDCMLQMPAAAAAADALREFLNTGGLKKGEKIKSMTVRTAPGTGEVMVILGCSELKGIERLAMLLDDAVYGAGHSLESIYYDDGGKEPVLAAGKYTIDEIVSYGDKERIRFEISPRSFYQVNPEMMRCPEQAASAFGCSGSLRRRKQPETVKRMIRLFWGSNLKSRPYWMPTEMRSSMEWSMPDISPAKPKKYCLSW